MLSVLLENNALFVSQGTDSLEKHFIVLIKIYLMIMTFLWFSGYVTYLLFNSQRWLMNYLSLLLHFGCAFFKETDKLVQRQIVPLLWKL